MFKADNYRIVETKEEFMKGWKEFSQRYDYGAMPMGFSLDTATFPLGLKYHESIDPHSCGDWIVIDVDTARNEIARLYQEEIDYYAVKLNQLMNR